MVWASDPSTLTGKQFSGSLQNGVATRFSKVCPANYFIRSGGRNVVDQGLAVGSPHKRAPQAYSGQYVEERSREGRRDRPRMARRSRCYWRVSAVTLGRPTCQRRPRRLTAKTEGSTAASENRLRARHKINSVFANVPQKALWAFGKSIHVSYFVTGP